jgi:nicotinate-nucleotide pyrophosphorylase (carboxylating)
MPLDFSPVLADSQLELDTRKLVALGIAEDFQDSIDWTTRATVHRDAQGVCSLSARAPGIAAGLVTVPWILSEFENLDEFAGQIQFTALVEDGQPFVAGQSLGRLFGTATSILQVERLILNVTSRLCGVATLTNQYVQRIAGTPARLYDTRKTTTGWRRLEKYAVRCGGGHNHRSGLYDAFLIKDNHLALAIEDGQPLAPSAAVERARILQNAPPTAPNGDRLQPPQIIEIEVDSLEQFANAIVAAPDIILLDNFSLHDLRAAVEHRNSANPQVQLEASGGVTIHSIAAIAATGVDRISCGALTHQATWLDLGLDWLPYSAS